MYVTTNPDPAWKQISTSEDSAETGSFSVFLTGLELPSNPIYHATPDNPSASAPHVLKVQA